MVSLCLEEEMVRINTHFLFNYRKIKLLTREQGAANTSKLVILYERTAEFPLDRKIEPQFFNTFYHNILLVIIVLEDHCRKRKIYFFIKMSKNVSFLSICNYACKDSKRKDFKQSKSLRFFTRV
jgi:hypothetical protein